MSDPKTITLAAWNGSWTNDDPDANFKTDIAAYSNLDPLTTITNLATAIGVPVGALCHYILAKWASAGSEALLQVGPTAIERMATQVAEAEDADTDEARLIAYDQLRQQIAWLRVPLDTPEAYPDPAQ